MGNLTVNGAPIPAVPSPQEVLQRCVEAEFGRWAPEVFRILTSACQTMAIKRWSGIRSAELRVGPGELCDGTAKSQLELRRKLDTVSDYLSSLGYKRVTWNLGVSLGGGAAFRWSFDR